MSEYIKKEDALKAVSDMAYENSATIRELLTELPTYSFPDSAENKGDTVSRVAYEQIMWERDTAIQQLKDLGYGLGEKPKDNKDDFISRQAVDRLVWQYLRKGTDENITFYEHFLDLPSVENKGEWIKYGVPRCGEQHYKCTSCGYYINFGQWGELYTKEFKFCPNCGADMRPEPYKKGEQICYSRKD